MNDVNQRKTHVVERALANKMTLSITSQKIQEELLRIIAFVKKKDIDRVFCEPVDVVALGLHDYHSLVSNPMDLSTVEVTPILSRF